MTAILRRARRFGQGRKSQVGLPTIWSRRIRELRVVGVDRVVGVQANTEAAWTLYFYGRHPDGRG